MPISWKENGKHELQKSLNLPISPVNILTYNFKSKNIEIGKLHELGFMMHGIEFELKTEHDIAIYFSIFNAFDQNGLSPERAEQEIKLKE